MTKYRAIKTEVAGIKFDSKREAEVTPIEHQCAQAMHRIREQAARSAGQHMRAIRAAFAKVMAG